MTAPIPNPDSPCSVKTACCSNGILQTLHAEITSAPTCSGLLHLKWTLGLTSYLGVWEGDATACGQTYHLKMTCVGPGFSLQVTTPTASGGNGCQLTGIPGANPTTCDPLKVVFTGISATSGPGCACCTSSGFVTITVKL